MTMHILATGGTIDKVHDPITESLIFKQNSHLKDMLRQSNVRNYTHDILMLKDSLEVTEADRDTIAQAVMNSPHQQLIITHGTSTMEVTARYLIGKAPEKTVVLCGAMRPFSLYESDAKFNLGGAFIAAQTLPAGVYVAMNGRIFDADNVRKNREEGVFETLR